MLNEIFTRIHVAHDQAVTAAVIGQVEDLNPEDRKDLNEATKLLGGILSRHEEEEGN